MHSSTSSSDTSSSEELRQERRAIVSRAPPQIFERSVPLVAWPQIILTATVLAFLAVLIWELRMRQIGLHAGDLDDGRDYWAVERRKVADGPRDSIVIIGDSRILYGTDLQTWERLTGQRPIQLARVATNAFGFLRDLAADENFAGLVVVGIAEVAYFNDRDHARRLLDYVRKESPSQRVGHLLHKETSRHLAFLDSNYTLFSLIEQRKWPEREGVVGPYSYAWKLGETTDDRQTFLWDRIERDAYLRGRFQRGWLRIFAGDEVATDVVDRVIEKTRHAVDRIRARGGEVVWIRPPAAGPLLELEQSRFPRAKVWDRLLRETRTFGVYFEDYPSMRRLCVPDWSHLSQSSIVPFTEAYVRVLLEHVPWLQARRGAPGPSSASSQPMEPRCHLS